MSDKPSPSTATKECPSCKNQAFDLLKIDTGMKVALESVAFNEIIHPAVCSECYQNLSSLISEGARLRAQKIAKEENKKIIYRQRIELLKKAREEMAAKNLPNAAMFYEKYIQSLATGFDLEPTALVPSLFNGQKFKKELILVSAAYLDLFKIYDQVAAGSEKFLFVKNQLKLFSNLPSTRPTILRKLRGYRGSAINKAAVEEVIKTIDINQSSKCFIATVAFASYDAPEVKLLCQFRDQILSKSLAGSLFIKIYYCVSPNIAKRLEHMPILLKIVRSVLRIVASRIERTFNLKS